MNNAKNNFKTTQCAPRELVEVITEQKEANVIIGGNVFISVEDAKAILCMTRIDEKDDEHNTIMLHQSRAMVRAFAKAILYTPTEEINLNDITSKYF